MPANLNRKQLREITPGSGKSFSAKREITNAFLVTDDDIIICDPEAEYAALVHKFNGQVVKISSSSTNYINPMDINLNYSEDDNPVALKADFILSLCELIMGSKDGLQPIEKTVIDRCVHQIYQRYFDNPAPENMPILTEIERPSVAKHMASRGAAVTLTSKAHQAVSEYEDDNIGVQAVQETTKAVESTAYTVDHAVYSHKLKAYDKAEKLVEKSDTINTMNEEETQNAI